MTGPFRTPLAVFGLCSVLACTNESSAEGTNDDAASETATSEAAIDDAATDTSDASETTDDPAGAQCQAELQDCPEDYKCVLRRGAEDWEFVCLPVLGDKGEGESCQHDGVIAGTDDCDAQSWCIGPFDPNGAPWDGACYPFCVGGDCEGQERCVGIGSLPVCAPICDPLLSGSCASNEACIFRPPEGFVCFPQGAEGNQIGEPCPTGASCAAGLHCSQKVAGCGPEDYCCTDYCDTQSDTNTCTAQAQGAACEAIGATDPNQAHVGACVIPD